MSWLYTVFIFSISVLSSIDCENTSLDNGAGIHLVTLFTSEEKDSNEAKNQLLYSACRLNFTHVEVLNNWCPTGDCKDDSRLEEHLENLPEDDWVIVINPGNEFVYLMTSSDDAKKMLISSHEDLILAVKPPVEKGREGDVDERIDENEGNKEDGGKGEGTNKKRGSDDKAEGEEKVDKEEGDDKDGEKVNEVNGDGKRGEENQEENKSENGDGDKTEEEENPFRQALKGGTLIGQVSTLLKVLRNGQMPQKTLVDTAAQHVLFGSKILGNLGVQIPVKAIYIPEEGGEAASTSPFIIYSPVEKLDFYNIVHIGGEGPEYCSFTHEEPLLEETQPRILVSLDISNGWVPFLEEVLLGLSKQEYPKENMDLWIHTKSGVQEKEIQRFIENGEDYASVEVVKDESLDMASLSSKCVEKSCDYLVVMEPRVLLEDTQVLTTLIAANRPAVAPLLTEFKKKPQHNFVYLHGESSQWEEIILKHMIRGTVKVSGIKSFVMFKRDVLDDIAKAEKDKIHHSIFFINNERKAGYLLDPKGFKKDRLHPDLWGMRHNRFVWVRRYIHPDVLKVIRKEKMPEKIGPYLYYMPFYTERYCQDMVEEMENHGKWFEKDVDDRDVAAHAYASRNINFEEIDYALDYHLVLNSVHKELLAALYENYKGVAEASLIFVLKYASARNYGTFNYHLDGASYTFNIALNNAFTGGGIQYKMGNYHFGDEQEFIVPHNRTGWAVIQPNRPLHSHRGIALESGTRYAMINIIDTNDENAKGGPVWLD